MFRLFIKGIVQFFYSSVLLKIIVVYLMIANFYRISQ